MIVGNRKEFGEILEKLGKLRRVLVLGCNECVTVCGVGGEREVGVLASELRLYWQKEGETFEVKEPLTVCAIRATGFPEPLGTCCMAAASAPMS